MANYRWEIIDGALTSVEKNGATKNDPVLISGSIEDGMLKNAVYSLSNGVNLDCNKPWVVEWKTFDNPGVFWTGCILAEAQQQKNGRFILQSKTESHLNLVIGEYDPENPSANNGYMYCTVRLIRDGVGTSTADAHTYRLENRLYEDGSHKVFLCVDDVEIGSLSTAANWVNEDGADMVFNYIGTTNNTVRDLKLDYLQVWESYSEPVPVEPLDPTSMTMGWLVGRAVASQRK